MPPVILLGSDCLTGLQVARILWRKSISVIGIADNPSHAYCKSRAVTKTIASETMINNPAGLLQSLFKHYATRPVIMICTDAFVWWVDQHREEIQHYADFILPPSNTLQILSDKAKFYRYAIDNNLPIPETRFVSCTKELNTAAREMTFPLIAKPPRKSEQWLETNNGAKVLKFESSEELIKKNDSLLSSTDELILQAWIPGPTISNKELSICFDRQNKLLASIVLQKIRLWPHDTGTGSLCEEIHNKEILGTGLDLFNRVEYVGTGQIEYKQDARDQKYYIIEMNVGRIALNFPLFEACGVEIIYATYCEAAGLPLPDNLTFSKRDSKWIAWNRDLASALKHWQQGDMTLREWLITLRGHKWSADIQWDDPLPFLLHTIKKAKIKPTL